MLQLRTEMEQNQQLTASLLKMSYLWIWENTRKKPKVRLPAPCRQLTPLNFKEILMDVFLDAF